MAHKAAHKGGPVHSVFMRVGNFIEHHAYLPCAAAGGVELEKGIVEEGRRSSVVMMVAWSLSPISREDSLAHERRRILNEFRIYIYQWDNQNDVG